MGTTGVSSAVQAAVAFYPPTNFLAMDFRALRKCDGQACHNQPATPIRYLNVITAGLGCA